MRQIALKIPRHKTLKVTSLCSPYSDITPQFFPPSATSAAPASTRQAVLPVLSLRDLVSALPVLSQLSTVGPAPRVLVLSLVKIQAVELVGHSHGQAGYSPIAADLPSRAPL